MVSWGRTWKSKRTRKTQFTADRCCPSAEQKILISFLILFFFIVLYLTIPVDCLGKERNEAARVGKRGQRERKQQVGTG